MATNTDNQKEYNEELLKSQKIMTATAHLMGKQAQLLIGMVASMQGMDMSKVHKEMEELEQATFGLKDALKEVEKTGTTTMSSMTDGLKKAHSNWGFLTEEVNKLDKTLLALGISGAGALSGFGQGLKLSMSLTGALMDQTKHLVVALLQVGASIITAPFKMLQGLINMSAVGGSNEFAQQLEEIRKEFGYLKKSGGAQIIGMFKEMRGELANTGLSVRRIFGTRAETLKYFADYAKALGPVFDSAMNRVGEGGAEALGAFNKALGFTNEGLKAVATRSLASGVSINEINRQVANYALQLSDTFGVVQKQVTKAVGDMMADFSHFGHLSAKELTQTAVYARKLGLEIKTLGAVMDKWMNFEDAAQGAAQLSQAFGLNIDALNMMKAQNPADKIEQLRKAFFRAGKSVETMTYQERRLLTQQTGLDDAGVSLAFSLKSQGTSYDQITKKGNAAQKAQLTQTQALHQLSGAIERMVKSGEGIRSGFIDTFFKGFVRGMTLTRDFRSIMRNLQKALRATLWAGRDVGRMFVRMMPGVKEFFGGLAGFFEPRRFRVLLTGVKGAFHTFFEQIAGKDPRALPNFLKNLKNSFLSFFDSRTQKGQMFLNGARKLFTAFVGIVNGLLKEAIQGVTKGVEWITKLISGEITLSSLVGNLRSTGGFFGDMLSQLIEGLPALGSRLGDAFLTLWERLKTEYGPRVIGFMQAYLYTVMGIALGGAFARGFLFSVGGLMVEGLKNVFARMILRSAGIGTVAERSAAEIARSSQEAATRAAEAASIPTPSRRQEASVLGHSNIPQTISPIVPKGTEAAITDANAAATAADRSTASATSEKNMLKMAKIMAIGMVAIIVAIGLIIVAIKYGNVTFEEIAKAGVVMGIAAGTMVAAAGSAAMLMAAMKFSEGSLTGLGGTVLALGSIMGVILLATFAVIAAIRGFDITMEEIAKTAILLGVIPTIMLAASGVALVAMGIGAAILASGGAALGAIGIGLIVLTGIVEGMVEGTMKIIQQIKTFQPGTGFAEKAQVFVSIIQAVGTFAGNFATIAAAARPSILNIVFSDDTMSASLKAIKDIVKEVGDQVKGLIGVITETMTAISPEQLQKGRQFIEILGGVGEFVHNLMPPAATLSSTTILHDDQVEKIHEVGNFIQRLAVNLRFIFATTLTAIRSLQQISLAPGSLEVVRVFAEVLKSIGILIPSLMPSPAVMAFAATTHGYNQASAFLAVSGFMKQVMKSVVESKLLDHVSAVVTNITNGMQGLNSAQITRLKNFSPILTTVFQAVNSIAEVIKAVGPLLSQGSGFMGLRTPDFTGISAVLTGIFNQLHSLLPTMLANLNAIHISSRDLTLIREKSAALKAVFEALAVLPTVINSFTSGGSGTGTSIQKINRIIWDSSVLLRGLFGAVPSARAFKEGILAMSTFEVPPNIRRTAESIKAVFEAIQVLTGLSASPMTFDTVSALINPINWLFNKRWGGRAGGTSLALQLEQGLASLATFNVPHSTATKAATIGRIFTAIGTIQANSSPLTFQQIVGLINPISWLFNKNGLNGTTATALQAGIEGLNGFHVSSGITAKITTLGEVFAAFAGLTSHATNLTEIAAGATRMAEQIRANTVAHIGESIQTMVTEVNNIGRSLNNIQVDNVNMALRTLANDIGLGQNQNLTIQRGNFTINVPISVEIKAQDLQTVLVAQSRIVTPGQRLATQGGS